METWKKKIIIGYNEGWKTKINIGRRNNRTFYGIPYRKLINKLKDKLNRKEECVVVTEESYTSKCDALALEKVCKHRNYSGSRIRRGLFRSGNGQLINADVNGAINIMRKYFERNDEEITEITGQIFSPKKIIPE